ncbi:SRR1-like protein isoform X2 [Perognathus longimembris pacificus]|uniref:SRR1-like protein isoform X2 n=1 Tax=Perognathus longimembris pacificus TaxID=214514 RepID=UPI0020186083|nr:SRR1-like protein isoform X2 [Perognathus longimembris pacificus]
MAAAAPEAWQTVSSRGRPRSAARRQRIANAGGARAEVEADCGVVLRRLREAENDLLVSDFWSSALEPIRQCLSKQLQQMKSPIGNLPEALGSLFLHSPPATSDRAAGFHPGGSLALDACLVQCVCYGLGNFASCITARTQLAFLLLLLDRCQIPRNHCWVYDPLFSQLEIAVLSMLGVAVLTENEEGKRSVQGEPTIFYMPHCGTALYNNLLWSNWSVAALSKMVVIGNSFTGLRERMLTRVLHKNYPYVAKEEPNYQECEDLEIIRKQPAHAAAVPPNPGATEEGLH